MAENKPPAPVNVGYVPATPIVTVPVNPPPEKVKLLIVPVIGKAALEPAETGSRLTLAGVLANVPELMPTFTVTAISWATTKYWITSPATGADCSKLKLVVKLNGEDALVASTYFQPLLALVFPA